MGVRAGRSKAGLGRINFGPVDDFNDEPGFFTGLFTMQDPVQNRRIMGIGRVNLGRARASTSRDRAGRAGVSFAHGAGPQARLRPHAARSAATSSGPSTSRTPGCISRTEFEGRPRMALRVSSNGKVLYVYNAGETIDLYDAATYKYLRTIHMGADQTTELFVVPPARPPPARAEGVVSSRPAADADLRRAFAYLVPYWRRLVAGAGHQPRQHRRCRSSLPLPLQGPRRPRAHRPRRRRAAAASSCCSPRSASLSFALNVVSGLRYTRVSAEILFDMRLAMYQHLQRLSPRFYARTRLGDIVSRINNDIGEIQRVAAEAALAWVGNVLFLARQPGDAGVARLAAGARCAGAVMPLSLCALVFYRRRLEGRVADAAAAQRRHRQLPDRDAAGDHARRGVERAGARGGPLPRLNDALHRRADVACSG